METTRELNIFKGLLVVWGVFLLSLLFSPTVGAETEVESYNPTEPEIQLGDVSELGINESGAVKLDTQDAQGQLDESGEVAIDGVKGKDKIYYILEKSGDIISVHVESNKITGKDGSTVKIVDVDVIHGNNGTADKDGFKSNIVPEGILPKTGIEPDSMEGLWLVLLAVGVTGIAVGYMRREKGVK